MISAYDEAQLAWDMKEPCKECPFRKDVPPERKGIEETLPAMVKALKPDGHGSFAHTCHRTDPRVTDGGFKEGYDGPIQMCGGFTLMMFKSGLFSGPLLRAMAKKKVTHKTVSKEAMRGVHTLKELTSVMRHWAEKELERLKHADAQ